MHIAIAGNIGTGKTTLAELLGKQLGYQTYFEHPESNPYIYDFYSDMQRWAFNLQVYFLNARLQQAVLIRNSGKPAIQDRTLYEDAEIFAPNLLAMGLLSERDYDTYVALYETALDLVKPPDLVIYLHGSISAMVDQIASRNRDYEDNIRIDYLKRLNERYEQWFTEYNLGPKIDFSIDKLKFRDNPEHLGEILKAIEGKLYGLFPEVTSVEV